MLLWSANGFCQIKKYTFTQQKMGSEFSITFFDSDSTHANRTAKKAFLIVDSLNHIFSDYDSTAELYQLSAKNKSNDWINISPALFDILSISKEAFKYSNGAFDITIGALTKLWRKTKKTKILPTETILKECMATVGFYKVTINKINQSVKFANKNTQLDLGGIAKGYAAQKVLDYLQTEKIKMALVNAAGNMAIGDAPPDTKGWKIGIQIPSQFEEIDGKMLIVSNIAVSTSGNLYQHVLINGKKYSHIIDPKTGLGLTTDRQVTILSENATQADWLSTASTILPIKMAQKLIMQQKAKILIYELKGNKMTKHSSSNFFSL